MVLDISVHMASFPSKEIALGSYNYRTLGLGYANLGGLLMRMALPYDSDEGRSLAAAITALIHFGAYKTSNEMAIEVGPFPRWEANKEPMHQVLLKTC
jgi:ribonucleoside-diphosphate reductase alpha chain